MITAQEHIDSGLYPKNIQDAVDRWDRGDSVWSVEMGGLGPGYEQCIQVGMIEVMRRIIGKEHPAHGEHWTEFITPYITEVNKKFKLELSGAQVGAIIQLVCKFASIGWTTIDEVKDRAIIISSHWPGAKQ